MARQTRSPSLVCGVYIIEHTPSKRVYVGGSQNVKSRWAAHQVRLRGGYHPNTRLQYAWNKDGKESFRFHLICKCSSKQELALAENRTIKQRKSMDIRFGFNYPYEQTLETKRKISISSKGKILSPECRHKISKATKRVWKKYGITAFNRQRSL